MYAPSKWETTLQCNVVSHWLCVYTKWSLASHWLGAYTKWSLHWSPNIHNPISRYPQCRLINLIMHTNFILYKLIMSALLIYRLIMSALYRTGRKLLQGFGCQRQSDGVIKWKHFPRYWSFVRRINQSPANSPHKGQWRGALMFLLICAWTNGWVNNRNAGDLRRHRAHYDVTVMKTHRLYIAIHHFWPAL